MVRDQGLRAADGVRTGGDVARWDNALFGVSQRLEHWTCAAEPVTLDQHGRIVKYRRPSRRAATGSPAGAGGRLTG